MKYFYSGFEKAAEKAKKEEEKPGVALRAIGGMHGGLLGGLGGFLSSLDMLPLKSDPRLSLVGAGLGAALGSSAGYYLGRAGDESLVSSKKGEPKKESKVVRALLVPIGAHMGMGQGIKHWFHGGGRGPLSAYLGGGALAGGGLGYLAGAGIDKKLIAES